MGAILLITMDDGGERTYTTSEEVAVSLLKQHGDRSISYAIDNDSIVQGLSINMEHVFSIQMHFSPSAQRLGINQPTQTEKPIIRNHVNMEEKMVISPPLAWDPRKGPIQKVKPIEKPRYVEGENPLIKDGVKFTKKEADELAAAMLGDDMPPGVRKALYRIECKCGAEYFCRLYDDSVSCRCRECKEKVFYDREAEMKFGENNEPAMIMTNKYFVKQDEERPRVQSSVEEK